MRTGRAIALPAGVPLAVLAAAAVLASLAVPSLAQIPTKMNYQVMLTNDSDEPLADQEVTLFFTMHDAAEGGTLLWSESHGGEMTNSIGVVSVTLGETSPLVPEHFEGPRWLEVAVNGQTLSPRRELVSSPYAQQAGDAAMLAGLDPEEYTLDDDLSNTGVVNTPGNPVDWTMLKNVPYGFADGTDDGSGADGHSLDAVDGDPVDAVYVDAEGRVGIGASSPYHQLVVGPAPSGLSFAHFANPTTLYGQNDGFAVGINESGSAFIRQNENASIGFLTNGVQRHGIAADGTFEFGTSVSDGVAKFYASGGGGGPDVNLKADPTYGGHLGLFEEGGDQYIWIEPDFGGRGGYLETTNGYGGSAFRVDADGDFGGDAVVSITGLYSETHFHTGRTRDDSVELPDESVSDVEILDEPGGATASSTAVLSLGESVQTIVSETIYTPAEGLVLAIGTVEAQVADDGSTGTARFAVSATEGIMPSGGGSSVRIPNTGSSGVWLNTVTVHGLFPIASSGSATFYLLAKQEFGSWAVFDRRLTLVYLPSSYEIRDVMAEPSPEPASVRAPGQ